MRALIVGPPAVGKSTLAKVLCEHYKLHHIRVEDVIKETMDNLVSTCKEAVDTSKETTWISWKVPLRNTLYPPMYEKNTQNHTKCGFEYCYRMHKRYKHLHGETISS